jgi:hypothetical protein
MILPGRGPRHEASRYCQAALYIMHSGLSGKSPLGKFAERNGYTTPSNTLPYVFEPDALWPGAKPDDATHGGHLGRAYQAPRTAPQIGHRADVAGRPPGTLGHRRDAGEAASRDDTAGKTVTLTPRGVA